MTKAYRAIVQIEKIIMSAISGMGYLFISIIMKNNVWVSIFGGMVIAIINAHWLLNQEGRFR